VGERCTVFISTPDALRTLQQHVGASLGESIACSDADALGALDLITKRRPELVVLDRMFAATPRGAALINRIKADPTLHRSEIRVLSPEGDGPQVLPRATAGDHGSVRPTVEAARLAVSAPDPPVDRRGTRRAPRFKITGQVDMLVDGNTAALVNLSACGAHVVSETILKPNQRVRVALPDDAGVMRFNAAVAWSTFELPPRLGPRYRAGIDFVDADWPSVDAFCGRHRI
jgi:CheY-like chemotaxis protein